MQPSRLARRPVPILLAVSLCGGLPFAASAQPSSPVESTDPDPAADPPPPSTPHLRVTVNDGVGLAILGAIASHAGTGLSIPGIFSFTWPYDSESRRILRTCGEEHAFLAPAFVGMAGGGLLMGYGIDYARGNNRTVADAARSIRGSTAGLVISSLLLGTSVALYVTSATLHPAAWSEVIGSPSEKYDLTDRGRQLMRDSGSAMLASLLLAFPAGTSTGVFLNRVIRDRFLLRRSASGKTPKPVGMLLTPALSRETYAGRSPTLT